MLRQRSEPVTKNLERMHIEAVSENDKKRYIKNRKKIKKQNTGTTYTCMCVFTYMIVLPHVYVHSKKVWRFSPALRSGKGEGKNVREWISFFYFLRWCSIRIISTKVRTTSVTSLNCPFSTDADGEGTGGAAKKKMGRACATERRRGENFEEQLVNLADAADWLGKFRIVKRLYKSARGVHCWPLFRGQKGTSNCNGLKENSGNSGSVMREEFLPLQPSHQ